MPLLDSSVVCLGASHAAVPLDVLERLSIPQDRISTLLARVGSLARQSGTRSELVVLSTCNRTEIYTVRAHAAVDTPTIFEGVNEDAITCLEDQADLTRGELSTILYRYESGGAEEHLFRVIAGLDSLVVGETQIIGQVTRAYSTAQRAGTAGPILSLLFESAIRASRRMRARASRAAGVSSAAAMAVRRAEEDVGDLSGAHALVLGTGEMGRLVVSALREKRIRRIDVMTRSADRAAVLSRRWGSTSPLPPIFLDSSEGWTSLSAPPPPRAHSSPNRCFDAPWITAPAVPSFLSIWACREQSKAGRDHPERCASRHRALRFPMTPWHPTTLPPPPLFARSLRFWRCAWQRYRYDP